MVSTPLKSLADAMEEQMFPTGKTDFITDEIDAVASRQTFTITYLVCAKGTHVMVNSHRHPRMKVVSAWVEVKDNSMRAQGIEIVSVTKHKDIAETYKAGVAIPLTLLHYKTTANFYKTIKIKADSDRLCTVTMLCESAEEQP